MVWWLTAARRPDISTRKITQTVPSTTAQIRLKPNAEPACAVVAIAPTSRNPPMLVKIPRAILSSLFMHRRLRQTGLGAPDRSSRTSAKGRAEGHASGRDRYSEAWAAHPEKRGAAPDAPPVRSGSG